MTPSRSQLSPTTEDYIKCPICGDTGTIYTMPNSSRGCPNCHGYGVVSLPKTNKDSVRTAQPGSPTSPESLQADAATGDAMTGTDEGEPGTFEHDR